MELHRAPRHFEHDLNGSPLDHSEAIVQQAAVTQEAAGLTRIQAFVYVPDFVPEIVDMAIMADLRLSHANCWPAFCAGSFRDLLRVVPRRPSAGRRLPSAGGKLAGFGATGMSPRPRAA